MSTETVKRPVKSRRSGTGAHALLNALHEEGIRHLFGVPGHGAYPIYDAINDFDDLRTIVGRNEQGITFAALTYAWVTGDVAVATSVPEAGLTNSATSLLEATLSQDRLLFVVEADPIHKDIANAVGRYYLSVDDPAEIAPAAHELVRKLRTQRPGTAILEITNRALSSLALAEAGPELGASRQASTSPDVTTILAALAGARKIAILTGASAVASGASAVVQEIAERLAAPVLTDGFSKGVLPENHPLSLGHSWTSSGPGEALLSECDAILVIGAPVAAAQNTVTWDPQMVVGSRSETQLGQQLLLVDWDGHAVDALPARGRTYGHVPSILAAINEGLGTRTEAAFDTAVLDRVREVPRAYARERIPWAADMLGAIRVALPDNAIVLADSLVGVWLERLHMVSGPCRMRFPWGTGTLGYGIPAAVGAKLAEPESEVVVIAGDGAALYNPQELATLQLYQQKVTVVVMNDNCYGAIKHNMTDAFGRSTAHDLVNPDFVRLGQAFGFESRRLTSSDDLPETLKEAIGDSDRSWLIEVPLELLPPTGLFDWSITHADAEPE